MRSTLIALVAACSSPRSAPPDKTAETLTALESRIAELENYRGKLALVLTDMENDKSRAFEGIGQRLAAIEMQTGIANFYCVSGVGDAPWVCSRDFASCAMIAAENRNADPINPFPCLPFRQVWCETVLDSICSITEGSCVRLAASVIDTPVTCRKR